MTTAVRGRRRPMSVAATPSPANGKAGNRAQGAGRCGRRAAELLSRTDSSDAAVRAARAARSLLPSAVDTDSDRFSGRVGRLIDKSRPDQPSAVRELGLAAVSAWQGLVTRRPPRATEPDRQRFCSQTSSVSRRGRYVPATTWSDSARRGQLRDGEGDP